MASEGASDGQPIRSGFMERRGRVLHAWRRQFYTLRSDCLCVHEGGDAASKISKRIPLDDKTWLDDVQDSRFGKKNVFKLFTNKLDYYFSCDTPIDRQAWVDAIRYRLHYMMGLNRPPGSPLSLETLQSLAAPLFAERKAVVTFSLPPPATPTGAAPPFGSAGSGAAAMGPLQSPQPGVPSMAAGQPPGTPQAALPRPGTAAGLPATAAGQRPGTSAGTPAAGQRPGTSAGVPAGGSGATPTASVVTPLPQYHPPGVSVVKADAADMEEEAERSAAAVEVEWNRKFQELLSRPRPDLAAEISVGEEVAVVAGRFALAAKQFGRSIIDEFHLPVHQKRIQPLALDDGTLPQGSEADESFIANNILFRFACDPQNEAATPGADDVAMKIAGHEIKGLRAYLEAGVDGMHVALTCLVDYKGFRLIALGLVNISDATTMVYGVSPQQQQQDYAIARMLKDAAVELNLKEHVVFADASRPMAIHTSLSVQGHRCDDGYNYIVNLSHVMPADSPVPQTTQVLTDLLRPELVRRFSTPLSSDVFLNVGGLAPDQAQNEADAMAASRFLHDTAIPEFVRRLDVLEVLPLDSEGLQTEMHAAGINMRYLGRVADATRLPHVRDLCTVEMVARVCKRVLNRSLRAMLRAQRQAQQSARQEDVEHGFVTLFDEQQMHEQVCLAILDFFNLVLGSGSDTDRFWNVVVVPDVQRKFRFAVASRFVHRPALFVALQHHCGVLFADDDQYVFGQSAAPFVREHLVKLLERSRVALNGRLHVFESASRGLAALEAGRYDEALDEFNMRLSAHRHLHGLHNVECQRILTALASIYQHRGESDHALLDANAALGAGRRFHSEAARTYNVLTEILYKRGEVERANECYEMATMAVRWHLGPYHPLALETYRTYGALLYEDKRPLDASQFFQAGLELAEKVLGTNHPVTAQFHTRFAHCCRALGDADKASTHYEKALLIYRTVLGDAAPVTAMACFFMAEALVSKAQLQSARDFSAQALSVRERVLGPRHPLTLNSLYQLGLIYDQMHDYAQSVALFSRTLAALKESDDEALLGEVQNVTRTIVRLKFRSLTPERLLILNKIRKQNRHFNDYALLQRVITELHERQPAEFVEELFVRIGAMDSEAYLWLACITQLVEDEEVLLRGAGAAPPVAGHVGADNHSVAGALPELGASGGPAAAPGRSPSFASTGLRS